jgi:3D (Asp-Asp-Asp) domain-containing protein
MPIISRSTSRKVFATAIASVGFVFVYEATIRDSRHSAKQAMTREVIGTPLPGTKLLFQATAYCKGTTTASGVNVRSGIAAADPDLLPVGSVISVNTGEKKNTGIYTIMDTGPAVQGRILDLYMWSCHEALRFGRQQVQVTVLRLGWNPRASTPSVVDTLFRSRQIKKQAAPPRTSAQAELPSAAPSSSSALIAPPALPDPRSPKEP